MKKNIAYLLILYLVLSISNLAFSQNPFITDQFTADPSARVFGDKVYVFPSHDIPCTETKGRIGWFCMEDYHVFSSPNLTDWTDHGMIVSQEKVEWANPTGYSMWAPDCISRNGKYYFYFPTFVQDTAKYGRGFGIGVATADQPEGPYTPEPEPIKDVHGIDPNVFIDNDARLPNKKGQAYLYWAERNLYVAKLKENMLELGSEPVIIQKVAPTLRGVGPTDASQKIQIDRYSYLSDTGACIDFLDTLNRFEGWKAMLDANAWVEYDGVDFGKRKLNRYK